MKTLAENITNLYREGLKTYLLEEKEECLEQAYEMGRKSLQEGFSELDIVEMHHDVLTKINGSEAESDSEEQMERASAYLKEWLAPFEVKLRSYRKVIDEIQDKNELLRKEIENRKEIERELQSSKEYFQKLIENAQDIITVLDHGGIIRYSSPSIERILGYGKNELNGRDAFQYVHEDDVSRVKELFAEVISIAGNVVTTEFRFQHQNGDWIYLESIAKNVVDSRDGPIVVVNSRDVTDRKKAMRSLQEHKIQLADAQKIAKVGSWQWFPNSENGVRWSDEMCRIFGIEPDEFDNTFETYMKFVHPRDRVRVKGNIKKAVEEKKSFSFEHKILRPDGEERTLLCRGHILTNENGSVVKVIGTGQDITGQKEKEQKLREYSNQLRSLSEKIERTREEERIRIARAVHDELGQMLTVLKMDVSMLNGEMKQKATPDVQDFFRRKANKILDRINTIIKSVQRITTELRPEVLDDLGLVDAIHWQADEFANRTGIEVEVKSNVEQSDFIDDTQATTLFRIFQETLTNIIRHAKATKVDIKLNRKNSTLYLIVSDNGVGISDEKKNASSSLGIIGMRERTQFLGGDMNIEGEKDKGTTVTLQIPLDAEKQ